MKIYDEFEGVIKPTEEESTPWWPEAKHPGPDAPNIKLQYRLPQHAGSCF